MKQILSLLALLTLLVGAHAQPPTPPTHYQPPTTRTKDGLLITPIMLEVNDVSAMMEINLWRFKIQPPEPDLQINRRLELRRPGKEPIEMKKETSWPLREQEFTFGLMPENGKTFNSSELLKVYTRSHQIMGDDFATYGDSSGLGACQNPIRDLKFSGSSKGGWGSVGTDGSIILMDFNTGEKEVSGKSQLVLVLTASKREPPKP